ncbi:PA domain-containing protein [Phenylobacterium sp.]|uniref:PA domain-containing protein n=1 Tax=Phenylobacterium sp. TaxID=1871053 RepID=UPI0035AEC083
MTMDPFTVSAAQADLERYVGFGVKASGGPGDRAAGAWLEAELRALGFAIERQTFEAPWFEPSIAEIAVDGQVAAVIPQAVVVTTPQDGISAPLVLADVGDRARLKGAIALVSLPHARWSSLVSPVPRQKAQAAFDAGAAAVVLITHGPTGQALALNAPADGPMFPRPAAILAPKAAPPFLAAAARGEVGRLTVAGAGGRREAYNIVARLDRGRERWLVVSTPRSGWFGCAGERGPGVAIWLMLARWAARADLPVNVAFVCNSGHEYENLGAARLLHDAAPKPAQTAFWLHLGANAAARDWHELGGQMTPLPSADPQRYLGVSHSLIDEARRIFAGQPGLEAPYPAAPGAAGELGHIIAAGYPALAGVFGAHRFHHAAADDLRTVEPAHAVQAAIGFRDLIQSALKSL